MATYRPPKKKTSARVSSSFAGGGRTASGTAPASSPVFSSNTTTVTDKATGASYVADANSPIASSSRYTRSAPASTGSAGTPRNAGLKEGGAPSSMGSSAVQTGYDLNGNPFTYTSPLGGRPFSNTASGQLAQANAQAAAAAAQAAAGTTPGTVTSTTPATGYTSTPSTTAPTLGSDYLSSISQGAAPAGDTLASLGVTPASLAYDKYKAGDKFAQQTGADAQTAFNNTMGVAQNTYNLGQGYLDATVKTGLAAAERTASESLAANEIDRMKSEQEYEAAVAANKVNREKEAQYLKQKLASAGAINSTAGLEILVQSSSNYESALAGLQGDRQIALAEFALADTQVRNAYATTVEDLYSTTAGLRLELTNAFQTAALNAVNTLATAKTAETQAQESNYYDYLTTLSQIDAAEKAAQAEAEAQARADQQQAFENAVSLAGLTGTFVDPITGESIRTLNGMKFDADMAASKGSGPSKSSYADLLKKGLEYGILTTGQGGNYESVANDEDYQALLEQQITQYEAQYSNIIAGAQGVTGWQSTPAMLGAYNQIQGLGAQYGSAFPIYGQSSSTDAAGVTSIQNKNVYPTPTTTARPSKSWNPFSALGF